MDFPDHGVTGQFTVKNKIYELSQLFNTLKALGITVTIHEDTLFINGVRVQETGAIDKYTCPLTTSCERRAYFLKQLGLHSETQGYSAYKNPTPPRPSSGATMNTQAQTQPQVQPQTKQPPRTESALNPEEEELIALTLNQLYSRARDEGMPEEETPSTTRQCPGCHNIIPKTWQFCSICGKKL